jgi:hypothetical protein
MKIAGETRLSAYDAPHPWVTRHEIIENDTKILSLIVFRPSVHFYIIEAVLNPRHRCPVMLSEAKNIVFSISYRSFTLFRRTEKQVLH